MTAHAAHLDRALAGAATGPVRWIDDIRQAFARHREYLATLNELRAPTDRELADLGISRHSIADIARESAYAAR